MAALAEDSQLEVIHDAPIGKAIMKTHTPHPEAFLEALVGFMQAIIRRCVPSSAAHSDDRVHDYSMDHGQKLVMALEEFITATARNQLHDLPGDEGNVPVPSIVSDDVEQLVVLDVALGAPGASESGEDGQGVTTDAIRQLTTCESTPNRLAVFQIEENEDDAVEQLVTVEDDLEQPSDISKPTGNDESRDTGEQLVVLEGATEQPVAENENDDGLSDTVEESATSETATERPDVSDNGGDDTLNDSMEQIAHRKKALWRLHASENESHDGQKNDIEQSVTFESAERFEHSEISSPSPSAFGSGNTMFEVTVLKKLRRHLFNKVPIRLISFDSNGSQLQLIDRNEIFRRILPNIYAEVARAESEFTWAQEATPWKVYKRKTKLVADLVERHARYAILSHTWIRDTPSDVVYQDWEQRASNSRGFAKVAKFCEVAAREHGVTLGWIDTVCINKDSSSELDESIRSMYKWYREAYVCVAYLSESRAHALEDIHQDSWFSRGWTLQELLAPRYTHYYDMKWVGLLQHSKPSSSDSTRQEILQQQIQKATGITAEELQLCKDGRTEKIPISRIMQLASKREVTRNEDTAYSLMGLLRADIPIAYGEGSERALLRLVRELLKSRNNVLDIFNHGYRNYSKKLIPSNIMQYRDRTTVFDTSVSDVSSLLDKWKASEPIILTHLGVRIPLLLIPGLDINKSQYNSLSTLFSGHVQLQIHSKEVIGPKTNYYLLDRKIYEDLNFVADRRENTNEVGPLIATFGVINFGVEYGNILLPRTCLSVPLDCGTIAPGNVDPSNKINVIAASKPPVFKLKSSASIYKIATGDLGDHGMQLVTLYL